MAELSHRPAGLRTRVPVARQGSVPRLPLVAFALSLGLFLAITYIAMLIGYALLFVGIGLFIQGWRELYSAHQENRLATDGLYGLVRHPQYTGLFIGLFGEGVVHWPTVFSVILFPIIVFTYTLLAYREERQMLQQFGEQYCIYQQHVPMFFPGRRRWRQFIEHSHMGS